MSFNGSFYSFNSPNKGTWIKTDRPYYIWVIGKKGEVIKFVDKYDITSLDGYENHLTIYNNEESNNPFYSILNKTNRQGSFRKERGSDVITSIKDIGYDRRKGNFQFSVAVDFAPLYLQEDYFLNEENYELISSSGDKFNLVSIDPIGAVHKNDNKYIKTATHFLTIECSEVSSGDQTLNIGLVKKIPDWVASSSTLDDATKEKRENKTFAFDYLIQGVSEAFYKTDNNLKYFSLPIKLNR